MKKILITGISGQDGIFLTKYLLEKSSNINITGISRSNPEKSIYTKLNYLGLSNFNNINIYDLNLEDKKQVNNFIADINPDVVYNLSGPSSVYKSFLNRDKKNSILNIFNNLTSAIIKNKNFPRFFQASSSEMFGASNKTLNENSPFNPNSPYAEAKLINHLKVKELNENYNWPIFSGIMFNHESEFRNKDYLIMKIIRSAQEISINPNKRLTLGSLDYIRDWSYASDTVNAIYEITSKASTSDYVIGSGVGKSIKEMVNHIFNYFNLDWTNFVDINQNLLREGDPVNIVSDPSKLKRELNWNAEFNFNQMLDKCIKGFNKLDSV
jgi:GDPmannose 4,6-dehydratase